jgi:hypothetical protein
MWVILVLAKVSHFSGRIKSVLQNASETLGITLIGYSIPILTKNP